MNDPELEALISELLAPAPISASSLEQLQTTLKQYEDGAYFGQCTEHTPWAYMYKEYKGGQLVLRCLHDPAHVHPVVAQ